MTEPLSEYLSRLVIALLIGGAIGLEREFKGKPAGLRTNMLICFGSCLIMIISIEIARASAPHADPGRIAAQVLTGIGFIGAGTIMRSRFHVTGLTTAATIWVLSALGLAIGAGYFLFSVIGAALISVTLVGVGYVEEALTKKRSFHAVQLTLENREGLMGTIYDVFAGFKIPSETIESVRAGDLWKATFEYNCPQRRHHDLIERLTRLDGVRNLMEL